MLIALIHRVYNILSGEKEAERVLYKDDHPENGFLLLPDLKWDQVSMNAMVSGIIPFHICASVLFDTCAVPRSM